MMRRLFFGLCSLFVLSLAQASAASDYAFRLHNHSDGWTINGFYTYQEGQWSDNWLNGSVIRSGQVASMDWFSNEGACVVPFRVNWIDYGFDEFTLDWCQDVDNIYMENVGFSWD